MRHTTESVHQVGACTVNLGIVSREGYAHTFCVKQKIPDGSRQPSIYVGTKRECLAFIAGLQCAARSLQPEPVAEVA